MIRADMIPDEAMNALLLALFTRKSGKECLAAALNAWPGVKYIQWDNELIIHIKAPLMDEVRDRGEQQ